VGPCWADAYSYAILAEPLSKLSNRVRCLSVLSRGIGCFIHTAGETWRDRIDNSINYTLCKLTNARILHGWLSSPIGTVDFVNRPADGSDACPLESMACFPLRFLQFDGICTASLCRCCGGDYSSPPPPICTAKIPWRRGVFIQCCPEGP
jgi:hypothetical protein